MYSRKRRSVCNVIKRNDFNPDKNRVQVSHNPCKTFYSNWKEIVVTLRMWKNLHTNTKRQQTASTPKTHKPFDSLIHSFSAPKCLLNNWCVKQLASTENGEREKDGKNDINEWSCRFSAWSQKNVNGKLFSFPFHLKRLKSRSWKFQ